jgi:hypothetical protein
MAWFPPALAQGLTPEPGDHPDDIHSGGIQELLEVRPRQAKVPIPAEINASNPLREATLDARPQGILGFELRWLLALPRDLERLMVGLRSDRVLASFGKRA